jgi:hypothetical protein
MSDYSCFNCSKTTHVSELNEVKFRGLVSLLCDECIEKMFVDMNDISEEVV